MQIDLCSAGPNDKTLKVKESTMAREREHSKDNQPQSRNVKLSLEFRSSLEVKLGKSSSSLQVDGRSSTCSFNFCSVQGT